MSVPKNASGRTALGALCSALVVVFLALSALFPSFDLTLSALAALVIYVLLLEFGAKTAFLTFSVSALLALLLLPNKTCALFFLFFFGWYPFFRVSLARFSRVAQWCLKLICAVFAGAIFYLFFGVWFVQAELADLFVPVSAVLFLLAFVLYDLGLARLLLLYRRLLRPKLFGK